MKDWSAYRWGEAAVAAALLGLGVYMIAATAAMPAGSLAQPGPAVFPFAIGMLLVVIAGGIVVGLGFRAAQNEAATLRREAAITMLVLIAAALAFERVGALVTFAVLLATLYGTLAQRAWWKAVLFGLGGAAVAWVLFARVLGVGLPGPGF